VDLTLTWRYYGSVENINGVTQNTAGVAIIDYDLDDQNYFDLAGSWNVTEKASIMLGINNVLDDDPPLSGAVGTTGNGNTYPQTYDAMGRWIFMRAQIAL
jgi:outer membrane receptor protein involved in Fe transport